MCSVHINYFPVVPDNILMMYNAGPGIKIYLYTSIFILNWLHII